MSVELKKFIERLIEEKKFIDLDEEVLKQIKRDLASRLNERINAAILEKMPPEKLEKFEKLLDNGSEEEIQKFCQDNIANLDEVIAGEMMNFRATYLNL